MGDAASGPENQNSDTGSPNPQAVRMQLDKILSSPGFSGAERLRGFLEFVVTRTLEGQAAGLKEVVIGVELFGKPDFDPKLHGAVRITSTRVRKALEKYYAGPGKDDSVLISLPSGHYVPEFAFLSKPAEEEAKPIPKPSWRPNARHLAIAQCVILLIIVGSMFVWRVRGGGVVATVPPVRWGRILAKATSESGRPKVISLKDMAEFLAASPDEREVYTSAVESRILTVISTKDDTSKTQSLPQDGGPLAVSSDGAKLYISSRIGGIMVIDTRSDLHTVKVMPTAGPVVDLALTPDGRKLYAAMGPRGVWRFLTEDWTAHQLTNQGCPEHLNIGPNGRTLAVIYQCGGPGGSGGRDSVELFDARTEEPIGALALSGKPFIGGPASFSPDGQSILLDGLNACDRADLNHDVCPSTPTNVFYFVRMQDRQILKSIGMPVSTKLARFIDPARVLVIGSNLAVINASLYTTVEKWAPPDPPGEAAHEFVAMALIPNLHRVYVADRERREMLVLDSEADECATPLKGLVASFTGDGVLTDAAGTSDLSAFGGMQFRPGRVGQAFAFDGVSAHLVAPSLGHFRFGYEDSSFALYAKFDNLKGTMTILDRRSLAGGTSVRLAKTPDNRLALQFALAQGTQLLVNSRTQVVADRWYHIAVTRDGGGLSMYMNGVLEDRQDLGVEPAVELAPIYFGATWDGKASLRGKLDEIAFYDRALTADQVRDLYQKRESGACRM